MSAFTALVTVTVVTVAPAPQTQASPNIDDLIQAKIVELETYGASAACMPEVANGSIVLDASMAESGDLVLVATVNGQPYVALISELDGQWVLVSMLNPLLTAERDSMSSLQFDFSRALPITDLAGRFGNFGDLPQRFDNVGGWQISNVGGWQISNVGGWQILETEAETQPNGDFANFGDFGDLGEGFGDYGDLEFSNSKTAAETTAAPDGDGTVTTPMADLDTETADSADGGAQLVVLGSDVAVSCVSPAPNTVACSYMWGNKIRFVVFQLVNDKWTIVFDSGWCDVPA